MEAEQIKITKTDNEMKELQNSVKKIKHDTQELENSVKKLNSDLENSVKKLNSDLENSVKKLNNKLQDFEFCIKQFIELLSTPSYEEDDIDEYDYEGEDNDL